MEATGVILTVRSEQGLPLESRTIPAFMMTKQPRTRKPALNFEPKRLHEPNADYMISKDMLWFVYGC